MAKNHDRAPLRRLEPWLASPWLPVALIAIAVVAFTVLQHVLQIWMQKEAYFVGRHFLGHDFATYHTAARSLRDTGDPYRTWYPTFPLVAFLYVPLTYLSDPASIAFMFFLYLAAVPICYVLVLKLFPQSDRATLLLGLGVLALGYPYYYLLDRLNTDGLVLLCLTGALWAWFRARREWAAGALFATAACIKMYPVLLVLPLALYRKKRIAYGALVALAAFLLLGPSLWLKLFSTDQMTHRLGFLMPFDNLSIAYALVTAGKLVRALGIGIPEELWLFAAYFTYAALLVLTLVADLADRAHEDGPERLARMLMYFPFLVALPRQVYPYEAVQLYPLMAALGFLWTSSRDDRERRAVLVVTAGVALAQFQAGAFASIVSSAPAEIFHFVPSLGVTLALFGCTSWKSARGRASVA